MASRDSNTAGGVAYQIPRNSLALLMVSQVAVVLPLAVHISLWIVAVCLFCGFWRTQVHLGRWGYPGGWIKLALVVAAFTGIGLSDYRSFSLEAAASLLVLAFALKLVEMKNRRDAYLIIYLSYFLIATAFLFDQSMALAAYEVGAAILITAAMVGMNQLQNRVRPVASMRVGMSLVLQAVPLMLVLFMLFPRIAPLWSIPVPSATSTGISDRVTPGDIARLTKSDALAFRAVFDGPIPMPQDLYWRGLVYSKFAYGTWTIAEPLPAIMAPAPVGAPFGYEVFLEPTQSTWLFSLDTPVSHGARVQMLGDYRLVNPEPVLSVMRYRLASDAGVRLDVELDDAVRQRETDLGSRPDNPRVKAFAEQLYQQTGSPEAMVAALAEHIGGNEFRYTLNPPQLGRINSIDQFWFDTRAGFCTHYAGAVVYALRTVGIPARMVGGYQGGSFNPVTGHVVVRQYDAHAWVEVWLEGRGWTRFDPTAAVAPQRVEQGLNAALSAEDRQALSFLSNARMSEGLMLRDLLRLMDSLEYRWNLWVVGYDTQTQAEVLKNWLGDVTPTRVGVTMVAAGAVCLSLVALLIFWRRRPRPRHPVERVLSQFAASMARQGLGPRRGETPSGYLMRLARAGKLDGSQVADLAQHLLYDPAAANDVAGRRKLRAELRKIRFRLAFTASAAAS